MKTLEEDTRDIAKRLEEKAIANYRDAEKLLIELSKIEGLEPVVRMLGDAAAAISKASSLNDGTEPKDRVDMRRNLERKIDRIATCTRRFQGALNGLKEEIAKPAGQD